jgi:hypothetical protein
VYTLLLLLLLLLLLPRTVAGTRTSRSFGMTDD